MRLESSVKIENKEEKKELRGVKKLNNFTLRKVLVFLVALVMLISFAWGDSNGVWHEAEDVRGTVFGADEGYPNYIFNSTVDFAPNGKIDMNGNNINNVGRINMQGKIVMNNNNIEQAKYIYGNRFYDRDDTGYALEPASNSNMRELTLNGILRMNDNNVGGKNGQGVRKVNFENHEWGHFSCSDNDDVAGSLFYDRSEGVALCRKGNIEELANKNYVDGKVAGISDTNAATECSGDQYLGGNGNCYSDSFEADTVKTASLNSYTRKSEDGSYPSCDSGDVIIEKWTGSCLDEHCYDDFTEGMVCSCLLREKFSKCLELVY